MAFFRPHPGTPKRIIFDWAHWFVGNSAYLLAVITLVLAVDLPAADLSGKNVEVALIIYVVMHIITHLLLTGQHYMVSSDFLANNIVRDLTRGGGDSISCTLISNLV